MTYTIKLTNSPEEVIVDACLYNWLSASKWYLGTSGYAEKVGDRRSMHRLIANPSEGFEVDHINGVKLDNRQENLRVVTHSINLQARSLQLNNKSGYRGVSWSRERNLWLANISIDGKTRNLGRFETKIEAALAYNKAAVELYGPSAKLNEV